LSTGESGDAEGEMRVSKEHDAIMDRLRPEAHGMEDRLVEAVEGVQGTKQAIDDALWRQADWAAFYAYLWVGPRMRKGRPPSAYGCLGPQVGFAPKTLELYAQTALMFWSDDPEEPYHRRLHDEYLTFHHHLIAASSNDPLGWLERAAEGNLSTAEMKRGIREAEGVPEDDVEDCPERVKRPMAVCKRQGKVVEDEECRDCPWRCGKDRADGRGAADAEDTDGEASRVGGEVRDEPPGDTDTSLWGGGVRREDGANSRHIQDDPV
jgi:hypothetical protein